MAAMTLIIAMGAGAYAATTTSSVNATATLTPGCLFGGGPALAFGTIAAGVDSAAKTATVTDPTLYCTSGYNATITDDDGANESGANLNQLSDGSGNFIPYTLSYDSTLTGLGAGAGNDIGGQGAGSLSLTATIGAGVVDTVPAGSYSDTVVLTVTY